MPHVPAVLKFHFQPSHLPFFRVFCTIPLLSSSDGYTLDAHTVRVRRDSLTMIRGLRQACTATILGSLVALRLPSQCALFSFLISCQIVDPNELLRTHLSQIQALKYPCPYEQMFIGFFTLVGET